MGDELELFSPRVHIRWVEDQVLLLRMHSKAKCN